MSERFARISEAAVRCRELSAADWRVLACVALHADARGRAWPSMATIADMTGLRRQDVPRTIRRLERLGMLRCEGRGPRRANVYAVIPAPMSAPLRSKQTIKQTIKHTGARQASRMREGEDGRVAGWFERFWKAYPSRGQHANPKKPARAKFLAAIKNGIDPELLIRAAENYAAAMRRAGTDGRFVKTAEVWLNKASWEQYGDPVAVAPLPVAGMI
jgi:hypothetical protein